MLVSVLINNYNNGRFIKEAVSSVLGQSRPADEVIVYDDGSSDDSMATLAQFGEKVRVVHRPNWGKKPSLNQGNAIHQAFMLSRGDIIFLLDGDDGFLPGKIETYLQAFTESDVLLVQSATQVVNESGSIIRINSINPAGDDHLALYYKHKRTNFFYQTSALAWRRRAIERFLPIEDDGRWDVWPDVRMSRRVPFLGKVVTLSEPFTRYRVHAKNHYGVKKRPAWELLGRNLFIHQQVNSFAHACGARPVPYWRCCEFFSLLLKSALGANS
ncbi:glycosyltransferase [Geminisphaera colitermitum]|uniref:glycosyltransferase n=1 Tax=Geminisphaera colitermitum TaxID=1148786 RepID=UPI000158D121|nr:glycosyltransferase [Geminisphaera colitermitum]